MFSFTDTIYTAFRVYDIHTVIDYSISLKNVWYFFFFFYNLYAIYKSSLLDIIWYIKYISKMHVIIYFALSINIKTILYNYVYMCITYMWCIVYNTIYTIG